VTSQKKEIRLADTPDIIFTDLRLPRLIEYKEVNIYSLNYIFMLLKDCVLEHYVGFVS
jgi:hypothetical protein